MYQFTKSVTDDFQSVNKITCHFKLYTYYTCLSNFKKDFEL